ncbi:MAG: DHCW motif cupin fold protein [Gemmatimonadota bacterium]
MRIEGVPFATIDWDKVPETEHPGETGAAYWRKVEMGNIRVRRVRYAPGYQADHWCSKGHVLLVLEGELTTELKNGTAVVMAAGMSYQVADDAMPHRSRTAGGATLFIVD